jgi:hypothetical protein
MLTVMLLAKMGRQKAAKRRVRTKFFMKKRWFKVNF